MTSFAAAIERALEQEMARDDRIVVLGEDVRLLRRNLVARFGPRRVRNTPISEAGFMGAAVGAAMAGLRPVAELMLVDFVGVALDPLLNHAAKLQAFSGGTWHCPLVVRTACGGGYGDGGQHEQCLWGLLGGIPGLTVVVPATPADAAGLMVAALRHDGPVVFMEHKLLADYWLDYMGGSRRASVAFDVPAAGVEGAVPIPVAPLPLGRASLVRDGSDVALVSLGVGVHRCLAAAEALARRGCSAAVLDLRTVAPLDREAVARLAARTSGVVMVDEDYLACGLSGEVAATISERGIAARFARVATEETIPYARPREREALPSVERITAAAVEAIPHADGGVPSTAVSRS